jgi:hypothetical protein
MACACFALASGLSEPALAVRSPGLGRYILCGTFRKVSLNSPSRTLSGTLLCGVRTFLSLGRAARVTPGVHNPDSDHPVRHQLFIL